MLIEVVAIILAIVYLAVSCGATASWFNWLIDMPSLIGILILTLPFFFRKGMWQGFVSAVKLLKKDFRCSLGEMKKAQYVIIFMQKQLLCAGAINFAIPLMYVLSQESDLSMIGIDISVIMIGVLYIALLEILLLPLELEVKRRIADYMGEE